MYEVFSTDKLLIKDVTFIVKMNQTITLVIHIKIEAEALVLWKRPSGLGVWGKLTRLRLVRPQMYEA